MENEGEIVRSSRGNNDSAQTLTEVTIREWIMVLILWFLNLINYMDRFTIAGMLEDIQSYFKIQNDKGGLLQTGFIFSYMIFAPVFGYLGDRYNRKNILAISVLFWSLATLVGSFMQNYWLFLLLRFFVGIGEASYSTVAPTIISDVFALDVRSYMLALFYFAIPIGCGSGYIVGSEMAKLFGAWQWGLRLTPILGVFGAILSFFVLKNPERGASDGNIHISTTPWTKDLKNLLRNRSFLLTTAAATCVSFVAGVLTWWGPKYLKLGFDLQSGVSKNIKERSTFIFGVITMIADQNLQEWTLLSVVLVFSYQYPP
ncbi:MFS 1, Sugar tr and/or OATP domain containing protein [Asbolus verrucosus]|uniref:MFS 1, Sugar tr and/or OATP domain containing protein n=1 Tax=Asbolus verrucosus TaxID=1661398 RepID=A0A482VC08_ASBVE|nr:MFS 1, Sugar tr and/or OATP domain containing protein [Asbolus verrucosus]